MQDLSILVSGIEFKLRKLIQQNNQLKIENDKLLKTNEEFKKTIENQNNRIKELEEKYKVLKEEEEIFRKATKLLAEKITEYAQNYAFKDKQDLLALVALQYTTSSLKFEEQASFKDNELIVRLSEIDGILNKNISTI